MRDWDCSTITLIAFGLPHNTWRSTINTDTHYNPGGGGAAYAKETNVTLTPGGTIDIQIGVGGQAGFVSPTPTWAISCR